MGSAVDFGALMLTLRELRIFLAICEAHTFSKAAARLGGSQPSLSRTIRDMESRLGMRLFSRNGRGVDLTDGGRILHKHAEIVLGAMDDLYAGMEEIREDIMGSVTILLPTHVSQAITPALVKTFTASFPKAKIHIFEDNNARILERVQAGEADLGLYYDTRDENTSRSVVVATEDMYLVRLPDGKEGTAAGAIAFSDISGMPLVLPRPKAPYRQFLEQAAVRNRVQLNVVRELEMGSTLLAFVLEREGATILPHSHFHQEARDGLVDARVIVEPRIVRWVKLVRGATLPSRILQFSIKMLTAEVQRHNEVFAWTFTT